ncbi:MFS transporter [Kineosporia sp. J2-2]|uniref:MFS transporter n=1 Tax=Kineosporia corallincola TaxID=2835133 RepID=A0ABS5TC09_9ACTN|nr:MFS transporter [Kineosporia corallincola]MBT0768576.1 MFS transporter [Kineosporia corallincola]
MNGVRAAVTALPAHCRLLVVGVAINRLASFVELFAVLWLVGRGDSAAAAGLALTAFGAGTVAGVMLGGVLTERLGNRWCIALSMLTTGAGTAALPFAPDLVLPGLPGLSAVIGLCGLLGATTQLFRPAAIAALAAAAPARDLVLVTAGYRFGLNVGAMLTPLLGTVLAAWSWTALFLVDAAASLVFGAIVLVTMPADRLRSPTPVAGDPATPPGGPASPVGDPARALGDPTASPRTTASPVGNLTHAHGDPGPVAGTAASLVGDPPHAHGDPAASPRTTASPVGDPTRAHGDPGPVAGVVASPVGDLSDLAGRVARQAPVARPSRDRAFRRVALGLLLIAAVEVQYVATLPLEVRRQDLPDQVYALLVALNGLLVIAVEPALTSRLRDWTPRRSLIVGIVLIGAGIAAYGLPGGVAVLFLATLIWTAGEMIGAPAAGAYPALVAPPSAQARYLALAGGAQGAGAAIGPVLGVAVWTLAPAACWIACVVTGVVAAGLIGSGARDVVTA